jgi:hypothetical protein
MTYFENVLSLVKKYNIWFLENMYYQIYK